MSTPNLSSSNFRCCLMDLHALCSPSVSRIVLSLKTGWWCWLSGLQCVQSNSKTLNGWYNPSSNGGFMVLGLPQCQQSWTHINVMHGKWPTIFSISSPDVLVVVTYELLSSSLKFSWQHPKCAHNFGSCDTRKIRKIRPIQNKSKPTKRQPRNVWASVLTD